MATTMETRKRTLEKGGRLNRNGRVERTGPNTFVVRGDSGTYELVDDGMTTRCPCPSRTRRCSHVEAVELFQADELDRRVTADIERERAAGIEPEQLNLSL